jgi:maltooligosyltrehalose synthase
MEQPASLIETGDTSLTEEQARAALKRAMCEPPAGRVPSSTYAEPWRGTTLPLPAGRYRNLFTGEIVESDGQTGMDEILHSFPVALLERQIA